MKGVRVGVSICEDLWNDKQFWKEPRYLRDPIEELTAKGAQLLVPAGHAKPALERFYRRAARSEVGRRLDAATAITGHPYNGLSIRAQRTRWASCSPEGHMSFNWRLLLAPEHVLDYVVWHEVCHLEILEHSPRFWRLLERRWPGYRADRAWLSRYGVTLVL